MSDPAPSVPPKASPAAALLGAGLACALVLAELGLSGPVGPGPMAVLVGIAVSVLFPGVPAVALAWAASRLRPGRAATSVLVGAATVWALLPHDPIAWAMAGVAAAAVGVVPARSHAAILALLAGLHAAVHVRLRVGVAPSGSQSVVLVTVGGVGVHNELPSLASLAAQGVLFDEATTPIADEGMATAALLAGRAPWEPVADDVFALADARGLVTAAFVPHRLASVPIARVDTEDTWLVGARSLPIAWLLGPSGPRRADMTVDRAAWWMARQDAPFLAWVHLGDVLQPLDPPPPFDERYGAGSEAPVVDCALSVPDDATWRDVDRRYRGTIDFVDYELGRLIARAQALGDEVVIVVVGTHGLTVEEPAACGQLTATERDWRVPLVIAGGPWPQGVVVSGPVETHTAGRAALTGEGSLMDASADGQSSQSVARSLSRVPGGWAASAGNRHGRVTVGAVNAWEQQSDAIPQAALRSLLEAQARRALMSAPDVDQPHPLQ